MPNTTLPAFNAEEYDKTRLYLATQVSEMMGRKFEEGDWTKVYCASKGIPPARWSNLGIDITHGNLGVEQKMIRHGQPLLKACGKSIMHPAETRAIRIPDEEDPTIAARIILKQYGEIIDERTKRVKIFNDYHHQLLSFDDAVMELNKLGTSLTSARNMLPVDRNPIGLSGASPDMRRGWLLWEEGLREFLYFEEPMTKPNPDDFIAEWRNSGGGRRKKSRNLWVCHRETGKKKYSITTGAGAKIQPYFTVPLLSDPNLYHFIVQREECGNGQVRVWLTQTTARLLKKTAGNLTPEAIESTVRRANLKQKSQEECLAAFGTHAVDVPVTTATYDKLKSVFKGASDEHNFKQFVDALSVE